MEKTIAFFDFDGTITRKDTMLELVKFSKGKNAYYVGMILLLPQMLAMKAGLISKAKAKEKLLRHFFGGSSLEAFNETCKQFSVNKLPALIRPDALAKIHEHQQNQNEVVVVSASAENWVSGWCNANGLTCLATKLAVIDGKITGLLDGVNCNADEKVCRIKLAYDLSSYSSIYCYGDTEGDKPMLQIATHPAYQLFQG